MKRIRALSCFFVFCLAITSYSATIESVSSGGDWSDTLTWVGYDIPSESDDVTINGTVSVTGSSASHNLTVSAGATLQNGGGLGWVVLAVKGNIVNNGTIRNNPTANELWIDLYGDIVNNGTWAPAKTCIASVQSQSISHSSGTEFTGIIIKKNNAGYADTFPVVAGSDLTVNASSFDGNGYKEGTYFWGVVDMAGHNLTLKGGTSLYGAVLSNVATLFGMDSSVMSSCAVNGAITLGGRVTLTDANVTFNGDVTIADTLQNGGGLGWLTPKFKAKLTNNGTIRNNPKGCELWLDLYGDIVNNGTWKPAKTCIASERTQSISQSSETEFTGIIIKKNNAGYADTFPVVAGSDLTVNASSFDGNGYKEGTYFWGVVDMAGHNLTLKGGTSLYGAVLSNVATLFGMDSSVMSSCAVNGAITLGGRVTLIDANVTCNGDVTIADTLQNGGGLGWLTPKFKAKLINNGTIRNNPKGCELWLDLYGDIVNNGTWKPAKTCIASERAQSISQSSGTEFTGIIIKKNNAGYADTFPVVAGSNLTVNASGFDCMGYKEGNYFWGVIDMADHNLTIRGATPLSSAVIKQVDTLFCNDSSYVRSLSIDGPVCLGGNFSVTDGNVHLNGQTTIAGVLQNGGGLGWLTLDAHGGIINNGTIRNNPQGNALWIDIRGNVANNGSWTNSKNTLVDTVDQNVDLAADKTIAAPLILDALWSGGPYLWRKDNVSWGGTSRTLTFDSVTIDEAGVYQCLQDTLISRKITIMQGGSVSVLHNPPVNASPQNLKFSWKLVTAGRFALQIRTPSACSYVLRLFDMKGRAITVSKGIVTPGAHLLNISTPSSGLYLARFEAGALRETRRVTLTR